MSSGSAELRRGDDAVRPAHQNEAPRKPAVPVIDSDELLAGGREIRIRHAGTTYRLQRTRQGKLILTK